MAYGILTTSVKSLIGKKIRPNQFRYLKPKELKAMKVEIENLLKSKNGNYSFKAFLKNCNIESGSIQSLLTISNIGFFILHYEQRFKNSKMETLIAFLNQLDKREHRKFLIKEDVLPPLKMNLRDIDQKKTFIKKFKKLLVEYSQATNKDVHSILKERFLLELSDNTLKRYLTDNS
ncbi:hypothetical protein BST97_12125 [Nonlabens spongiae]|uniref:Uncharacterized protein n=1 Tax=Nonlabens spongiae TaxID=331648 RepID=A0A1W6MM81_9FLAO|nr:hypothetical protein [Nonlabens spongiae]ARN78677.1 hypothetical protein BST97_12125 [Nonlabens spongiae]